MSTEEHHPGNVYTTNLVLSGYLGISGWNLLVHPRKIIKEIAKPTDVPNKIAFLNEQPDMIGETQYLDFSQGCTTLFISPPGSGKTFCLRSLVDELLDDGYLCVDLCSIKNNFYWSRFPVQDKFKNFLPEGRKPHGQPVVAVMPKYLANHFKRSQIPEGMVIGTINFKEIKKEDIITVLELESNTPAAQILNFVWDIDNPPKDIQDLISKVQRCNSSEMLRQLAALDKTQNIRPFAQVTISALIRQLLALEKEELFGTEDTISFVDILKTGKFPSLCFNGDRTMKAKHQLYIAHFARSVYKEIAGGKLKGKRVVFIVDDAGTLALPGHANDNPSCKDVILNDLISLGREYKVYVIVTTQNLSQIPELIVAQAKYIAFFSTIFGKDLKEMAAARNIPFFNLKSSLDKSEIYPKELPVSGQRSILVWKSDGKHIYGWVPAPASYHHTQEG